MNTRIKVCYPLIQNAGDQLNYDLIKKLSNREVVHSKAYNADMLAIGGALTNLQYSQQPKLRFIQQAASVIYGNRPIAIWGSGFLLDTNPNPFYRKNLNVCALRGVLSRQRLFALTGQDYDVPLADAGLLANLFLSEEQEKMWKIGIVPHYSQKDEPIFADAKNSYSSAKLIDITQPACQVINEISSCEYIISSSLHGLIFADALGVPSLHVLGIHKLRGGLFKFQDYYSSFSCEDDPWDLCSHGFPSARDIQSRYAIRQSDVQQKQEQLLACFPKFE